ncbi:MAG: hypothetical protein AB1589_41605 [Cyanobacteriota bacterium]
MLIDSLPTFPVKLATLQSAAVTAVWAIAFCLFSAIAPDKITSPTRRYSRRQ